MKQEPVAWRYKHIVGGWIYKEQSELDGTNGEVVKGEPLYTAPRELSDEEILEIYKSIWKGELTIEEINNSEIRFARAILKKASEK